MDNQSIRQEEFQAWLNDNCKKVQGSCVQQMKQLHQLIQDSHYRRNDWNVLVSISNDDYYGIRINYSQHWFSYDGNKTYHVWTNGNLIREQ